MRKQIENIPAVHIANPKTLEFQVNKVHKTFRCNHGIIDKK